MLEGKSAIVTGATSGIGLAIAKALGEAGANVCFDGMGDLAAMNAVRQTLERERGVKTIFCDANLMVPAEVRRMVAETQAAFGQVDILVDNAGIQHVSPIEDFPDEKWDQIIALNLSATFHAIKACFGAMKQRRFGRIVNIASAHGLVASPFKAAYVAAKHGLLGLTKTVALEGAEFGITCNAICPGYVWTPLVEKQIPDTAKARGITEEAVKRDVLLAAQPTKQFVTVEQVANLTVYLCSDAAAQITGTSLSMDGGWTAQ